MAYLAFFYEILLIKEHKIFFLSLNYLNIFTFPLNIFIIFYFNKIMMQFDSLQWTFVKLGGGFDRFADGGILFFYFDGGTMDYP